MTLDILIKSLASAAVIAVILMLTRMGKTQAAGVVLLFPIITLLGYYFIGSSEGSDTLREVVKSSIVAFPVWLLFMGVVYVALPHIDYRLALGVATVVWLAAAAFYLSLVRL